MSNADEDAPSLEIAPCQARCAWGPTGRQRRGLDLFACAGCGSEWVRSEPWTPIDSEGDVPASVALEAARRGPATSGRGEAEADNGGTCTTNGS